MRKQGILLIMLMMCVPLCSQNKYRNKLPQQHLKFMGIPIDGDLTAFTLKLIDKGFKPHPYDSIYTNSIHLKENYSSLEGYFTNEYCNILSTRTPISHLVESVLINYPVSYSWEEVKIDYRNMIRQYIIKYGEIKYQREDMPIGFYDGDGRELEAVEKEGFQFSTEFSVPNGRIILYITNGYENKTACVSVAYIDNTNKKKYDKEKNISIQKDI